MSTHKCPRPGCTRMVPNHLFACLPDWYALSRATRDRIYATARLPVMDPERRAVFRTAEADWERVES